MKKESFSINEAAQELNVTKQCIYKKIKTLNELNNHIFIKNNIKYISKEGLDLIYKNLNSEQVNESLNDLNELNNLNLNSLIRLIENYKEQIVLLNTQHENHLNDLKNNYLFQIESLTEQLKTKDFQIETKDQQFLQQTKLIENMQVLLKQHQDTNQKLIEEKKSIWQRLFRKK